MISSRRSRLLAFAAVGALIFAACGGDDDDSSSDTATAPEGTEAPAATDAPEPETTAGEEPAAMPRRPPKVGP